jgi:hypothetical protein
MDEIILQPRDPKLDRELFVNDLRSILDEIANQGGGMLPVTVYHYDRDEGCTQNRKLWLSDIKLGCNDDDKKPEVQLRLD